METRARKTSVMGTGEELFSLDADAVKTLDVGRLLARASSSGGSVRSLRSDASRRSVRSLRTLPSQMSSPAIASSYNHRPDSLDLQSLPSTPSIPKNLQSYVSDALEVAEETLGGKRPSIKKIAVVRQASMVEAAEATGTAKIVEPIKRIFKRRSKKDSQTSLVIAFNDDPTKQDSDEEDLRQQRRPKISITSPDLEEIRALDDGGITFTVLEEHEREDIQEQKEQAPYSNGHVSNGHVGNGIGGADTASESGFQSLYTINGISQNSFESSSGNASHKTPEVIGRKSRFWDFFTMGISITYAIGLLIVGVVIYASDLFYKSEGQTFNSEFFNMYLSILGIIWLAFLQIDITLFFRKLANIRRKQLDGMGKFELIEEADGTFLLSIPIESGEGKLPQYYCFSTGRHSGSFYLKAGAAAFCLGHLVHIGLNLGRQILFLASDSTFRGCLLDDEGEEAHCDDCRSEPKLLYGIFQIIFAFQQLYMIFKYSNVIVNRSKGLARFAFMHCIAASLCMWIYTIINETLDSIVAKKYFPPESCDYAPQPRADADIEDQSKCFNSTLYMYCYGNSSFDVDCLLAKMCRCSENGALFEMGPYLYPFSIEFSILVVGIWYVMWSNIGNIKDNKASMELGMSSPRGSIDSTDKPINEAAFIYADCRSTHKGLFAGLFFFVVSVIGVIVFFIMAGMCTETPISFDPNDFNNWFESALLASMLVTTCWVYYKIALLDVNPHPISFLDDLLLFICIPSFFLYFLVNIFAALFADEMSVGLLVTNIFMIVQVVIQTPMIMDGLRRCSDTKASQKNKPGRNLVTLLLIMNLAIYLWDTLEVKKTSYHASRKEFYGDLLWTLLSHMTLPLCIFYRFHSSVALADIWNSAYKPGDHH